MRSEASSDVSNFERGITHNAPGPYWRTCGVYVDAGDPLAACDEFLHQHLLEEVVDADVRLRQTTHNTHGSYQILQQK